MLGEIIKGLISPVTGIVNKLVIDKDKLAELEFKREDNNYKLRSQLLTVTTTPKVDAFVKLLITFRDVVIPILRPFGAACMTAFGMYMHYRGTPLDATSQIVMDAAFPAWGTSRHINKQTEAKKKDDWPDV